MSRQDVAAEVKLQGDSLRRALGVLITEQEETNRLLREFLDVQPYKPFRPPSASHYERVARLDAAAERWEQSGTDEAAARAETFRFAARVMRGEA